MYGTELVSSWLSKRSAGVGHDPNLRILDNISAHSAFEIPRKKDLRWSKTCIPGALLEEMKKLRSLDTKRWVRECFDV